MTVLFYHINRAQNYKRTDPGPEGFTILNRQKQMKGGGKDYNTETKMIEAMLGT